MALGDIHEQRGPFTIINGGAGGADYLARRFAKLWELDCVTVRAEWNKHGKAAGPLRNQKMIDEHKPDMVVAFPGGTGTADMIRRAKIARIETWEPEKTPLGGLRPERLP